MKPKMIWGNFSVKDVQRTEKFYTQLGFAPNNRNPYPKLVSFLFGESDFVIHFFEQGSRIDDYLTPGSGTNAEIIFTLSAETEEEVREFAEKVVSAGGTILKEVQRHENKYFGFAFADPDGHRFNVLLIEKGM